MSRLKCKKCNAEIKITDDYCPQCGAKEPGLTPMKVIIISIVISGALWLFDYPIVAGIVLVVGLITTFTQFFKKDKPKSTAEDSQDNNIYAEQYMNSLSIVWAESPHHIEFTYIDSNGKRSKRTIGLEEIAVNEKYQPYFAGVCNSRNEKRHFKVSRIASQIKFQNHLYDLNSFLKNVLSLDQQLIQKFDAAIANEEAM